MEEKKDLENRMGKFVRDFRIYTETSGSVDYKVLRNGLRMFIQAELDRAREEGKREVYEAIVFDKNIPHDVTTFVAANLWKNIRDKAKEELSKLTTK